MNSKCLPSCKEKIQFKVVFFKLPWLLHTCRQNSCGMTNIDFRNMKTMDIDMVQEQQRRKGLQWEKHTWGGHLESTIVVQRRALDESSSEMTARGTWARRCSLQDVIVVNGNRPAVCQHYLGYLVVRARSSRSLSGFNSFPAVDDLSLRTYVLETSISWTRISTICCGCPAEADDTSWMEWKAAADDI